MFIKKGFMLLTRWSIIVIISSLILYVMHIYSHNLNQIKPQDLIIMKYILNIDLLKNAII